MEQGISYFKMELDYLYRTTIKELLESRYGNSRMDCTNTEMRIVTEDGWYRGIEIRVSDGDFECYKTRDARTTNKIYHYYRRGLKTVGGDRNCDDVDEYEWLVRCVLLPVQRLVMELSDRGLVDVYVTEKELTKRTGVTKAEYQDCVRVLERFMADMKKDCGLRVSLVVTGYETKEHFERGITATLVVEEESDLMVINCHAGNRTATVAYDTGVTQTQVVEVAKQVMKTRGYTKYNQNWLVTSKGKRG